MNRLETAPPRVAARASFVSITPTIRVLVCGNADRGDDGAALAAVVRTLPVIDETVRDHLQIRRCDALRVEDIVDVPDGMAVCIVDAVVGPEAGTVVRMSLAELARPGAPAPHSSHQLPIRQVLQLASLLRDGLPEGSFVGVAGRSFAYGKRLSAPVRLALPAYAAALEEEIRALSRSAADMCVTALGMVVAIDGERALVEVDGTRRTALLTFEPDVAVGDTVLIGLGAVLGLVEADDRAAYEAVNDTHRATGDRP